MWTRDELNGSGACTRQRKSFTACQVLAQEGDVIYQHLYRSPAKIDKAADAIYDTYWFNATGADPTYERRNLFENIVHLLVFSGYGQKGLHLRKEEA